MLLVEGFQKFAGIPFGISRIFESLIPQQISANRHKNRSIQDHTINETKINVNTPKVVFLGGKFFLKFVQLKMYSDDLVIWKIALLTGFTLFNCSSP